MGSFTLVKPIGIPDDVAEVHSFEGRIEQSEYVVVHGAQGRPRLVYAGFGSRCAVGKLLRSVSKMHILRLVKTVG